MSKNTKTPSWTLAHRPPLPSSSLPTVLVNSAGVGLVNSVGPGAPGGQSSAPSMTPPSQIDPSSIERAYAALGLTYQGNQVPQQPSAGNMPNQGGLPGQPPMRSLNAMGEKEARLFDCLFYVSRVDS